MLSARLPRRLCETVLALAGLPVDRGAAALSKVDRAQLVRQIKALAIPITGTLGYDISFVWKIPTAEGYKIRVLTNRPIGIGEAWVNGRTMDYNLSAFEMDVSNEKGKSTGVLLPASQFKINKKTNELEIENFQNPWKLQNIMDRSKE